MQKLTTLSKWLCTMALLVFLSTTQAQCLPDFSSWSNIERVTYDGNWLLSENGQAYASSPSPVRTIMATTDTDTEWFGLNDYVGDVNFISIPIALPNAPVIRVGKKFNQTGQGELSPVRRASVATFTFTPTAQNCKVRVHYIGMLQEIEVNANFYNGGPSWFGSGALQRFRKSISNPDQNSKARLAASFGLFCSYEYQSNTANINNLLPGGGTISKVGRTEFGVSIPTGTTTFSIPTQNVDYGMNDMFCFSKAGTQLRTLPNSTGLNKKMPEWDSYIMDFSEFIGQSVTITLTSATSNYFGETQNHSYCYYQFECLDESQTPLPQSTILDIPDINYAGCLPELPEDIDINLTNTVPTLMGSSVVGSATVQQINNGIIHKWLHLTDVNSARYYNHFASLKVQLLSNNLVDYIDLTSIIDLGITNNTLPDIPDFRIKSLPNTPTSIDPTTGLRTYSLRVLYSTRNNPTVQQDTFNITLRLASNEDLESFTCNSPSTGSLEAYVNNSLISENYTTICKPQQNSVTPSIDLVLGASTCPNATYIWQRKTSLTTNTWTTINGITTVNFDEIQGYVSQLTCVTQFRRVTIWSTEICGEIRVFQTPSTEIFTVYNSGFVNASGSSSVTVFDPETNASNLSSNINTSLNNNILVCYGNKVTINANLNIGGVCNLPTLEGETAEVQVQFIVNNLTQDVIGDNYLTGNNSIQQNFQFVFDADDYTNLGIAMNGVSDIVTVPVRVRIKVIRNGCEAFNNIPLFNIRLFPRAIGGSILIDPICPTQVTNDVNEFTLTYVPGYTWQYCTSYTGTGTNATCNGTWQTIPNQNQLNLPLAALVANGINQPVIVRRVAQSGNNCGGAQNSNTIEINFPQEEPTFNLPEFFCQGAIVTTMPQANPAVSGTWHLMTAVGTGNTYASTPTTQLPANLAVGNYNYIFIPNTANTTCFAPVVWNFNVFAPVDPGTLSGTTTLAPTDTAQITATVAGGVWSSANTAVATVDSNGVVTAVSNGTTTITYTLPGNCPTATSITITVVNCANSTTWNGTTWSNGTPNTPAFLNTAVVFNANFSTTEDLYACSVTVNNNAEVVVTHIGDPLFTDTGHTFTVKHEVTVSPDATLIFEDDTSLVQIEDDANVGDIEYRRRTPRIQRLDYVYWSTPVTGQDLFELSDETPANRFYFWNPAGNSWVNALPSTTDMETGKGYIIRGPEFGFGDLRNFDGIFKGIPHNGTITTPVLNSTSKANLIGNPYPSALDIDCFLADPDNAHLGGFIRLWSHNIPIDFSGNTPGTQAFNYNINSYVTYNRLGGVGSGITAVDMIVDGGTRLVFSTDRPKGKVAAGQSFFVNTTSTGVATFKNNMRAGSQNQENSQFYRNANIPAGESSPCVSEDRHRLWLQIRNTTPVGDNPIQFKQTLVGYADNATTSTSLDRDYDSGLLNTSHPTTVNIYSLNPANEPLMIQGRALAAPFDTSDIIPLGFSCRYLISSQPGLTENTIQIAASEFDGLFETTDFWLRESLSGGGFDYHDIRTTPFEFTIDGDVVDDTDRFALVFTNPLPRQAQPKKDTFKVIASPNTFEKSITFEVVSDHNSNITIQIYDLLGKLVEDGEYSFESFKDESFGTKLTTGVYQAVITQGSQKSVQKIIKK